jgi:hypothetical protein
VNLAELLVLLDKTPVIAEIDPVSICYLPRDVAVIHSADELIWKLDSPDTVLPARYLITSTSQLATGRFPHIRCEHNPLTPALNHVLPDRFDVLAKVMLRQSEIAEYIVRDAREADVVVLMLVDGLSYEDVLIWELRQRDGVSLQPSLVDVPTMTRLAFPNIINSPSIAARLFNMGFHRRIGFSYWSRGDNTLTNRLFHSISDVRKVGDFREISLQLTHMLTDEQDTKAFIQIMRTGLDGYAHSQKRRPPRVAVAQNIEAEFAALVDLLASACAASGLRANLYLTSDHGILWVQDFEPEVVGRAPSKSNPRFASWRHLHFQDEPGQRFIVGGSEFYCLHYPKVRRNLRIDEQGIHGGVSYQESIVPFLSVKVVPEC